MSLSNDSDIQNPSTHFYEWKGSKGQFKFFDKSKADETKEIDGENVFLPLPFRFIVLDELATVKGFNKEANVSFYSNEVRYLDREQFIVRCKGKVVAKGLYEAVIDSKECRGAKYCKSVYIAFRNAEGKLEISNVAMLGSALSAWIDFRNKNKKLSGYAVAVKAAVQKQNGATTYFEPVFSLAPFAKETAEATMKEAVALDVELQKYLKAYFANKAQELQNSVVEVLEPVAEHKEEQKSESLSASAPAFVPNVTDDDLPF